LIFPAVRGDRSTAVPSRTGGFYQPDFDRHHHPPGWCSNDVGDGGRSPAGGSRQSGMALWWSGRRGRPEKSTIKFATMHYFTLCARTPTEARPRNEIGPVSRIAPTVRHRTK